MSLDAGGVRDSKAPGGPALSFAVDAWAAFVGGVREGKFGDGTGRGVR
ncbi:DUF397 domain-containing protein [Streptomyces sp. NPDC000941]